MSSTLDPLHEILESTRHEERRRAMRALLSRPVLLDDAGNGNDRRSSREAVFVEDAFVLVRRHAGYLGDWFARHTGWTLIIRSDSARLIKRPVETTDASRAAIAPDSSSTPLSRSRYVMWCLLLTVLHEEGRQSTLRHIAEKAVRLASTMPEIREQGIEFDLKSSATRRGIVCVVRLAIRYGVLRRVGGDEDRFAHNAGVDCLYNINPALLTDLLSMPAPTPHGPQPDEAFDDLLDPLEDEIRPRQLEQRLIRRMIDDPVMYFEDLTEAEFQYFHSQRSRLFEVIETATGLVAELRREGVAMLDPIGDLTDVKMPDSGTVGHATLLIAEYLGRVSQPRGENCPDFQQSTRTPGEFRYGATAVSNETLLACLSDLATRHKSNWRKGITELAQLQRLLEDCLTRLEMLRMIRRTREGGIIARPAIHRFVADEPVVVRSGTSE